MFKLQISERKRAGKRELTSLRADGFMPAVIYGRKEKTTSIKLSKREFKNVFKNAGESAIISLSGLKEEKQALIHEVDFDPVSGEPRHADFYAIEKDKKVTVKVPLEFVGVSPAVKELGGILIKVQHELEIEVLPKDLPQNIKVDIAPIVDFTAPIHVKDISLPLGVVALADPEEIVASASEAVEEIEEKEEEPDISAIEVEQKGKTEDSEPTEDN